VLLSKLNMTTIRLDQLTRVVGAAAPSPSKPPAPGPSGSSTNNLADWFPKSAADIKYPDITAQVNPPSPNFKTNTAMVESGPDRSWEAKLPGLFDHFGIK